MRWYRGVRWPNNTPPHICINISISVCFVRRAVCQSEKKAPDVLDNVSTAMAWHHQPWVRPPHFALSLSLFRSFLFPACVINALAIARNTETSYQCVHSESTSHFFQQDETIQSDRSRSRSRKRKRCKRNLNQTLCRRSMAQESPGIAYHAWASRIEFYSHTGSWARTVRVDNAKKKNARGQTRQINNEMDCVCVCVWPCHLPWHLLVASGRGFFVIPGLAHTRINKYTYILILYILYSIGIYVCCVWWRTKKATTTE